MNIIELSKIMASCQRALVTQMKCICVSRCRQNVGGGGLLQYSACNWPNLQ